VVQLWCATGVSKEELCNRVFYKAVGVNFTEKLTPLARDNELARTLWDWAEKVLARFGQAADMMHAALFSSTLGCTHFKGHCFRNFQFT